MPSPSLHELLLRVGKSSDLNNLSSLDTYILLKALVEGVEPEETSTDEEYNDVRDAIIRKLREERDERALLAVGSEMSLADARQTRDRLRQDSAFLRAKMGQLRNDKERWERYYKDAKQDLTDAKAKIERLRGQRDGARLNYGDSQSELAKANAEWLQLREKYDEVKSRLTTRREYWEQRCLKAEDALERLEILSADAEIGRLVRGMREDTSLHHIEKDVWSAKTKRYGHDRWINRILITVTDPAEALRAIWEMGDASTE